MVFDLGLAGLPQRFWDKVVARENGCWEWTGGKNPAGYGTYFLWRTADRRQVFRGAHRVAYETLCGPVPEPLVLDHLCRMPACVNPWHLEVVTERENILRGVGATAAHARKTHCPNGHPYDRVHRRGANPNGTRRCFVCRRAYMAVWRAAHGC